MPRRDSPRNHVHPLLHCQRRAWRIIRPLLRLPGVDQRIPGARLPARWRIHDRRILVGDPAVLHRRAWVRPRRRSGGSMSGIIVDLFAGGGGASEGIRLALGRCPDVAINHDADAIRMHEDNHPQTRHYHEDVYAVDPIEAAAGRHVELLWASPACTHFSRAKSGVPLNEQSRSLAWVIVDGREAPEANPPRAPRGWARDVRPAVIVLENVLEFHDWGPLGPDGKPLKERKGETFREFVGALVDLGYRVEWRVLNAADFGAPTSRRRLFLIARCDGRPITWPAPTHGPGRLPYRTAAECIDFRIPVPSIFHRRRPLAEKTLARIAKGIQRFVFDTDTPYVVRPDGKLFSPSLVQTGYGERKGQAPRILDLHAPLGAVVAGGQKHALVAAFLTKFYGTSTGSDLREPTPTTTAGGTHAGLVAAFLAKHYGGVVGQDLDRALGTVTAKDHHSLVTVTIEGEPHYIADIGMRILQPRELATAQGFRRPHRQLRLPGRRRSDRRRAPSAGAGGRSMIAIFLDIDGVLNRRASTMLFDPDCVAVLNRILAGVAPFEPLAPLVVLSSWHRHNMTPVLSRMRFAGWATSAPRSATRPQ
ncbi:hypothetical protein OUZ56_032639 [Daphnia magna]|uniref:DNA (cytosine-5-)-methyltransferase n=1 Tax=Daphnia magna TaxID=35525 RepID=A0ABR0B9G9_9CRUS|nr:hypothetical protein OUZ56_032639 [Daphnia magna]